MDLITRFSEEINQLLDSARALLEENAGDSINVKDIEARESLISQLMSISTLLPDIANKVENALSRAKTNHSRDLTMVGSILDRLKKKDDVVNSEPNDIQCNIIANNDASWTTVTRKKQPDAKPMSRLGTTSRSYAVATVAANPSPSKNVVSTVHSGVHSGVPAPKYTKIKFTEALSVPAISVPTFDYVKQDGELYYVESADHFAFKICGHMLHGNIGMIYTDEKSPEKIKDCKFADSCMKRDKCDYYHDPVKFAGSKDHRNFIASAWLYAPPNSHYKNRPRSRRFGSREYLDTDIVGLQEEEIIRFHDQAMHDLLCSILLSKAYAPS